MKKIITAALLLSTITAGAQTRKSYAFIGPAIYMNTKSSSDVIYGGTAGFASLTKFGSIGAAVDVLTKADNGIYFPVYLDIHAFLAKKNEGAYILAQPGYIVRSKTYISFPGGSVKESGGFYFGAGIGYLSHIVKSGVTAQLKYILFNTRINSNYYNDVTKQNNSTNAVALSVAVAF